MSRPNCAAIPENVPKVRTYSSVISHVCLLPKMSSWSFTPRALTGTDRSIVYAKTTPTITNGTQIHPAFWYQTCFSMPLSGLTNSWDPPMRANPTIHGVTNCTRLTPKLPMPAWIPSAVPCLALGKK